MINCFRPNYQDLRVGVSGLMRVKDDAHFIENCVETCIDALDELIIVYNDCSDDSPAVIEKVRQKYPDKIKVFPYEHHILSLNLSKEEYEQVKSLPSDDPRLLCNYYNFALSKVNYRYAVKIDADQMYFSEKLKEWCDFYRNRDLNVNVVSVFIGFLSCVWMKCVNRLCVKTNTIWRLLPSTIPFFLRKAYKSYSQYRAKKFGDCIILSGMNVVKLGGKWMVPKGMKHPEINILPPFNGAGDHVFFEVTKDCFYEPFDSSEYAGLVSGEYAVIERFVCPRKKFIGGYFWFHMNMERPSVKSKIEKVYAENASVFETAETFLLKNYYRLDKEISKDMYAVSTRSFSSFAYPFSKDDLMLQLRNLR